MNNMPNHFVFMYLSTLIFYPPFFYFLLFFILPSRCTASQNQKLNTKYYAEIHGNSNMKFILYVFSPWFCRQFFSEFDCRLLFEYFFTFVVAYYLIIFPHTISPFVCKISAQRLAPITRREPGLSCVHHESIHGSSPVHANQLFNPFEVGDLLPY